MTLKGGVPDFISIFMLICTYRTRYFVLKLIRVCTKQAAVQENYERSRYTVSVAELATFSDALQVAL